MSTTMTTTDTRNRDTRNRYPAGARAGLAILAAVAAAGMVAWASPAAAAVTTEDSDLPPAEDQGPLTASEAVQHVLPTAIAADAGRAAGVGVAWGGYDSGARAPVAVFRTEVRLLPRVVLMGGAGYAVANAQGQGGGSFRPEIGARVQVLDQRRHQLDLSVALLFREDRFGAEDGMFQGVVAVGRRFGRSTVLVNVGYGQDGEGDDHEGELRLTALRDIGSRLHLGVEGHARHSLASSDPRRAMLGTQAGEAFAGPLAAVTLGPIALLAEAGVDGVWTSTRQTGILTAAGFAAVF